MPSEDKNWGEQVKPFLLVLIIFLVVALLPATADAMDQFIGRFHSLILILIALVGVISIGWWLWKRPEVRGAVRKTLQILTPLILCGIAIGYELGRHWSPDFGDPQTLQAFVADHVAS